MATKPIAHCTAVGCEGFAEVGGRCSAHADGRETAAERGYGSRRWLAARRATLRRDPICTCTARDCHPDVAGCCARASEVADHHPESRRELLARGVRDPDAIKFLRGLCAPCHSRETAKHQPGGWNVRRVPLQPNVTLGELVRLVSP